MQKEEARLEPTEMARIPFLANLLPAEVEALCAIGEIQAYDEAELVFEQGDPGQELFVIIDGSVVIELAVEGGEARELTTLSSGAVFGEINFLLHSERTATAKAATSVRLLVFQRDAVEQLEGIGRQALSNVLEILARVLALRMSRMDREIADMQVELSKARGEQATPSMVRSLAERRGKLLHEWRP